MNVPFVKTFSVDEKFYCYDANLNAVVEISQEAYDYLNLWLKLSRDPISNCDDLMSSASEVREEIVEAQKQEFFLENNCESVKFPEWTIDNFGGKLRHLVIEVTKSCNLRCAYCPLFFQESHNNKSSCSEPTSIKTETIDSAIDFLMRNSYRISDDLPRMLSFYGGEPLLFFDKIKYAVAAMRKVEDSPTYLSITTNGVLLEKNVVDYLVENNIKIQVSLDGPKCIHDRYRKTKAGSETFDIIHRNLSYALNKYPDWYKYSVGFNIAVAPPFDMRMLNDYIKSEDLFRESNRVIRLLMVSLEHQDADTPIKRYNYQKAYDSMFEVVKEEYHNGEEWIPLKEKINQFNEMIDKEPFDPFSKELLLRSCDIAMHRAYCDVNGELFFCEKVDLENDDPIGNVFEGLDVCSINRYIDKFNEKRNVHCSDCWARYICEVCFLNLNNFENGCEAAERYCERMRNTCLYEIQMHTKAKECFSGS